MIVNFNYGVRKRFSWTNSQNGIRNAKPISTRYKFHCDDGVYLTSYMTHELSENILYCNISVMGLVEIDGEPGPASI